MFQDYYQKNRTMLAQICVLLTFALLLMALASLQGCATTGTTSAPVISPQAQAEKQLAEWQATYGATFKTAKATLENPASSQADKDICNKQLAVMRVVWPLLQEYEGYVKVGRSVAGLDVDQIIKLMAQLTGGS